MQQLIIAKTGFGILYAIWPEIRSDLIYSSQGLYRAKQHTDAFPALTVPFFLNTADNLDNFSTVESGFGCSSVSRRSSPTINQSINQSIYSSQPNT